MLKPVAAIAIAGYALTTAPAAQAFEPTDTIRIVNVALNDLVSLRLRPAGTDDWGPEELGGNQVAPNSYATVAIEYLRTGCFYDVLRKYADGRVKISHHVNLCGPSGTSVRFAEN